MGKNKLEAQPSPLSFKTLLPVCILVLFGWLIYWNSLDGQFIWDDEHLIVNNPLIKDFAFLPQIFSGNIAKGAGIDYPFYRPVLMMTLMLDYGLYGLNVIGYHVTTILIHILAALAVYFFIKRLFQKQLAFLTALFFICHPIHTENVAYITGRAEPLILIFILTAFIYYLKFNENPNPFYYAVSIVSFLLALLVKENSVILPALIVHYHIVFKRKIHLKSLAPIIVIAGVYTWLRLGVFQSTLSDVSAAGNIWTRTPGFFVALTNYARLMIMPVDLHMEYGSKLFAFSHPKAILGIIIFGLLIFIFIRNFRKNDIVSFSIGWFFVALLPVSNLIYPASDYMAERYMYLPSIGIFLVLAGFTSTLYNRAKTYPFSIFLIIGIISASSFLTIKQNNYWQEPTAFYERTLKYAPESAALYNNLASRYRKEKKFERAIAMYKKAIEINPHDPKAYSNLAVALIEAGHQAEAEQYLKKSISVAPHFGMSYFNLSLFYFNNRRYDLALAYCDQAIQKGYRVDPGYIRAMEKYRSKPK